MTVQKISVRGAHLAYVDSGAVEDRSAAVFVLSHSLFFDHTMFDELTALLVAAGHRVVSYDHRGQGESSPAPRSETTMDALTDDAAAFLEALQLTPADSGRVCFVGNSMGGFVGLRLAARRPDLVSQVAVLGSSAEEEHQLLAFGPVVDALGVEGGGPVIETLMHIMFGDTSLREGGELVEHWRARMAGLPPSIGDAAYNVIHRQRLVEELAGCSVPVLAVAGAQDHAYPPPISDLNVAAATGGEHRVIQDAGHSVALEQPNAVAELLLASLK